MIKKASINWTAKQLATMYGKGNILFDNAVQRGLVWDVKRKSLLIHSLIMDYPVPPMYATKREGKYDILDGKQRCEAIFSYINDKFELTDVPEVIVENDDGTLDEVDINTLRFSELEEKLQDAIKDFSLLIYYFDGITDDEVSEMFFRLNNGKALSAIELTRVKAKSMETIREIGKHELFKSALTEKALSRYTNEDMVIKSYAMLHEKEPSLETKFIRPLMESCEITEKDKQQLEEIYQRILTVHGMIEDKRVAKRIVTRTHMISIVPVIWQSLQDGYSDRQIMEWFVSFFSGTKSATTSKVYNDAAGAGSARKEAVKRRQEAIMSSYKDFFKNVDAGDAA